MGRTPGTRGAEAGARTRDLEVIPKFPPCEEALDSGARCLHHVDEWVLVLWEKRSERSQALLILSAPGAAHGDRHLRLRQSAQTRHVLCLLPCAAGNVDEAQNVHAEKSPGSSPPGGRAHAEKGRDSSMLTQPSEVKSVQTTRSSGRLRAAARVQGLQTAFHTHACSWQHCS